MSTRYSQMTPQEIVALLNSGKYLNSELKKQLQDRLNEHKLTNQFSVLDEFFSAIAPKNKQLEAKKNKEEFPTIQKSLNLKEKEQIKESSTLNFSEKLLQNDDSGEQKSLFCNGKLQIPYKDIETIYNDFAIYRVRMQYLILNRKIHILNSVSFVDPEKGEEFKEIFNYDRMVHDEKIMRNCLTICISLQEFITYFRNLSNILFKYVSFGNSILHTINISKLKSEFNDIKYINVLLVNEFHKYHGEYYNFMEFIESILNKLENLAKQKKNNKISELYEKCNIFLADSELFVNKIIADNDPHIICQYYVLFQNSEEYIVPLGLSNSIYLTCDEEINLDTANKYLDDNTLKNITLAELDMLFQCRNDHHDYPFINLVIRYPEFRKINIYYLVDEIPHPKIEIEITDLPEKSTVFSSIIRTGDTNELITTEPFDDFPQTLNWLEKKTNNEIYNITEDNFNAANGSIINSYTYMETSKNIFIVDYLFNELLTNDETGSIIQPDMQNSFRYFAKYHSTINDLRVN